MALGGYSMNMATKGFLSLKVAGFPFLIQLPSKPILQNAQE